MESVIILWPRFLKAPKIQNNRKSTLKDGYFIVFEKHTTTPRNSKRQSCASSLQNQKM